MALLAGFEPAPFAEELKDSSTSRLLADRIGALSGNEATSSVDALIRLAQQAKTPEVQLRCVGLFLPRRTSISS